MRRQKSPDRSIIGKVSFHVAGMHRTKLPDEVIERTKHHILDTLAAVVSGCRLKAGVLVQRYVKKQGGAKEATVAGSGMITSAVHAAFANAIMAHADETDDSHARSLTHPGCAIIPTALALSERDAADGLHFIKGVVAGYDIGCRITQALGVQNLRQRFRSTHSIGANFGAATAAASVLRLNEERIRYVLSYAAQQASGLTYWVRGDARVEKAFVFSGMPARNGVTAGLLVESGFTGVLDPFSGERNFLEAFSSDPRPRLLVEELGTRFEITATNIKKYPVGSPIQAPLEALLGLLKEHDLSEKDVVQIVVRLGNEGFKTVDNAKLPDINLQHLLAVALLEGHLSFEAAHSTDRMRERRVLKVKDQIRLVEDPELSASENKRQGIVEVTTRDGMELRRHVVSVRGTAENPMTAKEIEEKCRDLMNPVLGKNRTQRLIDRIWGLEKVKDIQELRPLLSAS